MSSFPSRPIFTSLTLAVLPLALACGRIETDARCQDPNRNRPEQQVVDTAMERAYDQVDFQFCRNQRCLVEVEAGTGCDIQTIRDCVTRHVIAAQGVPVAQASEATVRLTSTISRFRLDHRYRIMTPDVDFGEFRGRLAVTEPGPGAAPRQFKLEGRAQRAVI